MPLSHEVGPRKILFPHRSVGAPAQRLPCRGPPPQTGRNGTATPSGSTPLTSPTIAPDTAGCLPSLAPIGTSRGPCRPRLSRHPRSGTRNPSQRTTKHCAKRLKTLTSRTETQTDLHQAQHETIRRLLDAPRALLHIGSSFTSVESLNGIIG